MKAATSEAPTSDSLFRHGDRRYTCCCGIHVQRGATVVVIYSALSLLLGLFHFFSSQPDIRTIWFSITIVPQAACLVLLLLGLYRRKASFLLPYIAFLVVSCLILGGGIGLCAFTYNQPTSPVGSMFAESARVMFSSLPGSHNFSNESMMAMLAVGLLTFVLISLWFLSIIYRCYRYMCDMESQVIRFSASYSL